jgi:hypothetical protein
LCIIRVLLASGNISVTETDQAFSEVVFGSADLFLGSDGSFIQSLFGGFTYGVPQLVNIDVEAAVAYFPAFAGRAGSASAQFNGIEVVTGPGNPLLVANAVVSITQLPEPSLAWAVGLGLLGFVRWRGRGTRASRITRLSTGNERSSCRPKFNLRIRRAAKIVANSAVNAVTPVAQPVA